MGLFKKIKKGFKNIAKGVSRAVGGVIGKVKSLLKNKWVRYLAIGAAVVFTAGVATGAVAAYGGLGSATAAGWVSSVSAVPGVGAVFGAGASVGTAAVTGLSLAGAGAPAGVTSTGATFGAVPGAPTAIAPGASGAGAVGGAAETAATAFNPALSATPEVGFTGGVASGTGLNAETTVAGNLGTTAANPGLIAKAGGFLAANPTATLLAGNTLVSAFSPDEIDQLREQQKLKNENNNAYGINYTTGQGPGSNFVYDRAALPAFQNSAQTQARPAFQTQFPNGLINQQMGG